MNLIHLFFVQLWQCFFNDREEKTLQAHAHIGTHFYIVYESLLQLCVFIMAKCMKYVCVCVPVYLSV